MSAAVLPMRLALKATIRTSGCWEWLAGKDPSGYGSVRWEGRTRGAHRVAYEVLVGPVPDGLELDHLCRNRACINPAHLEPVTRRENVRRGFGPAGICARRTHCPRGHAYDQPNTLLYRGKRYCRACIAARYAGRSARR